MVIKPRSGSPRKAPKESSWGDLHGDVREVFLHYDQESIHDTGRELKRLGRYLKDAGRHLRNLPGKLVNLPVLKERVGEKERRTLTQGGERIGQAVGGAAAGGHLLGGLFKVVAGHRQRSRSRQLEGLLDIATAAVLGSSVAGLGPARAVLAPLAAGLSMFKGGYNSGLGYSRNDRRFELQGVLDAVRSAGSLGRMLKDHHLLLQVAGTGLLPAVAALQMGRGLFDLGIGLKNEDPKKQLKGLVDMANSVATATALLGGPLAIPAVAIAVGANLVKLAYQHSPRVRKLVDAGLGRCNPRLTKLTQKAEVVTRPLSRTWKRVISKLVKRVESPPPDPLTRAQMSAILQLVHCDGRYSKEEQRRLTPLLDAAGLGHPKPGRREPPPRLQVWQLRQELKGEFPAFIDFLEEVAEYDGVAGDREREFIENLEGRLR